jgi:hypothetical protein
MSRPKASEKRITITIPVSLRDKIRAKAERERREMMAVVYDCVEPHTENVVVSNDHLCIYKATKCDRSCKGYIENGKNGECCFVNAARNVMKKEG